MESIYGGRMSFYLEWTCFFFSFLFAFSPTSPSPKTEIVLFSFQVNTAVKFLQNPKVRQSPLATRKAFLKKKGEQKKKAVCPVKNCSECLELHQHHSVCVCVCLMTEVIFEWGGLRGHTGLWGLKATAVVLCPGGLTVVDLASEYMIQALNKWHTS